MAVAATALLTLITGCEDTTDWSGGSPSQQNDVVRNGTYALSEKVSNTTSSVMQYDQAGAGGVDMSGEHFWVWMFSASLVDTKANGGFRIYMEDTSGNWKTCYVGGSDTYGGGWQRFVCSVDAAADASSGTYNPANHRYLGVQFKTLSKANADNVYWDFIHYGSGVQFTSGATDAAGLAELYAADDTAAYGGLVQILGQYYVNGEIILGSTSAGLHIDFEDAGEVLNFFDNDKVASTLYKLKIEGNSTGTINVTMGTKSGVYGVNGLIITGVQKYVLDLDDSNIDILKLYGCIFRNAGATTLPTTTANREVISCTYIEHAEITPTSCTMDYCFSINADDDAFVLSSTTHNISNLVVIDPTSNGFRITTAGTYAFTNVTFSGTSGSGPYGVEFTVSGTLTWQNVGTSNAQYGNATGGGTIEFETGVDIIVTVKDRDGNAIPTAQTSVHTVSGDIEVMNEDTTAGGVAEETWNYTGDEDVYIRVRKSSTGSTRYRQFSGPGKITSTGMDTIAIMDLEQVT